MGEVVGLAFGVALGLCPSAGVGAGLPMAADRRVPADADCADFYLRPYDRNDGVEAAMREYLSWEIDLVNEVAKDGDAPFGHWH